MSQLMRIINIVAALRDLFSSAIGTIFPALALRIYSRKAKDAPTIPFRLPACFLYPKKPLGYVSRITGGTLNDDTKPVFPLMSHRNLICIDIEVATGMFSIAEGITRADSILISWPSCAFFPLVNA